MVRVSDDPVGRQLGHGNPHGVGNVRDRAPEAGHEPLVHSVVLPDRQRGVLTVVGGASRRPTAFRLRDTLEAVRRSSHHVVARFRKVDGRSASLASASAATRMELGSATSGGRPYARVVQSYGSVRQRLDGVGSTPRSAGKERIGRFGQVVVAHSVRLATCNASDRELSTKSAYLGGVELRDRSGVKTCRAARQERQRRAVSARHAD